MLLLHYLKKTDAQISNNLPLPFNKSPPEGPLPRLPTHLVLQFKKKTSTAKTLSSSSSGNNHKSEAPRTMRGGGGRSIFTFFGWRRNQQALNLLFSTPWSFGRCVRSFFAINRGCPLQEEEEDIIVKRHNNND